MINWVITDDPMQMEYIGRQLFHEKPSIYTEKICRTLYQVIDSFMPEAALEDKEQALFRSVYDYWTYGNSINEEFYLGFRQKTHKEKQSYLTFRSRFLFVDYLNPKQNRSILDDKYQLYQLIPEHFQRKMIQIKDSSDYSEFNDFCDSHDSFVVKPIDLGSAHGVRKERAPASQSDRATMFRALLAEAYSNQANASWGRGRPVMILEELIDQHHVMASMHPFSVNVVRYTTIRVNDRIYSFYPWIKFGANGAFAAAAATKGCCALIDQKTGAIISDGYDEAGHVFYRHPDTGIPFRGFAIPHWHELEQLAEQLANRVPGLNYIGWDFALTPKGWCVVEGNTQADFVMQVILGRGLRQELEELLKWAPSKRFWWE